MSVETIARWPGTLTRRIGDGPADEYGNPTAATEDVTVRGYAWQVASNELTAGGQISSEDWRIVLAGDVACAATDRIDLPPFGLFELTGPPHPVAYPPAGRVHHVELVGRQVT